MLTKFFGFEKLKQSSFYSELTMDAINFFGGHNGFLILFEHVAKDSTPIPAASAFMSAANQVCVWLNKKFNFILELKLTYHLVSNLWLHYTTKNS